MELGKEYFGPLWSFVASNEITDIDYNGKEIWLTNIFNERFRANQQFVTQYMTPAFVEQFTQRIANVVSRQFNKRNPELEAETSELRVTILHESVAKSGRSISIRKTPPLIRLTAESAIAEKFCSEELLAVLINCVKTKMNITFCGMPGIGKTECVKFFSQFIPANERVITIEDTLEIRYAETNPGNLGKEFNWATIAPETNDIGLAVTTLLQTEGYPQLYYHKKLLKKKGKSRPEVEQYPGWITTSKNRSLIIDGLEEDIRKDNITIKDPFFVQEAYTFIYDSIGRPVAMGKHNRNNQTSDIDMDEETYSDDSIFGKAIYNHVRKNYKPSLIIQPK